GGEPDRGSRREAAVAAPDRADPGALPAGGQRGHADAGGLDRRRRRPGLPRGRLLGRARWRPGDHAGRAPRLRDAGGRLMSTATLPAPLTPGRYRIAMVCLGNICRSPVAEVVLTARVAEAGLDDAV